MRQQLQLSEQLCTDIEKLSVTVNALEVQLVSFLSMHRKDSVDVVTTSPIVQTVQNYAIEQRVQLLHIIENILVSNDLPNVVLNNWVLDKQNKKLIVDFL